MAADVAEIASLWDQDACPTDPVELLVYQSNLLGADPRITNFGGGNTSAKLTMEDPLTGDSVEVLWVKGSGGDLASMTRSGLAALYMSRFLALTARYENGGLAEDDVVPLYGQCGFGGVQTPASIDTPLHGLVPPRFVNHFHADACIAIAAAEGAEHITRECFGGEVGFVPWKRPGMDLGLMCRQALANDPNIKGLIMGSHGIICWADDQRDVYELSLRLVNQAQRFIDSRSKEHPFGPVHRPTPDADRRARWAALLPALRGRVFHQGRRLIAHVDESDTVLDFLAREKMELLAALGTSCPDHFLRTKIVPLVLPEAATRPAEEAPERWQSLDEALARYRDAYAAYYERCRRHDSPPMRNPNPSVVLAPGMGMVAFGKTKQEASITAEFYRRAIEVMRGAETLSRYTALPEQEAFDIEYWWLEENKLRRQPAEKPLSGQIALVTGAAQGIGRATAKKLAEQGACVAMLDINAERLSEAAQELKEDFGQSILAVRCDVTSDVSDVSDVSDLSDLSDVSDQSDQSDVSDSSDISLANAFARTIQTFGGLDIVVVNAGNARRGTVADTDDSDYEFLANLLMRAYFQTMREAAKIMIAQATGGSIVVVASKNAVAAGSNAAVYSAAKAFELHLMRTAANDLAQHGIRANAVNPDAVLSGSGIWSDQWRDETARSLGIAPEKLEEHYRKRSLLGLNVRPEDVAEAIAWLCSPAASRTTGAAIPVDAGVREGFLR